MRQRGRPPAVRADDADDAAGRQLERQVVDEKFAVIGLGRWSTSMTMSPGGA
jgi:hypothetical protein